MMSTQCQPDSSSNPLPSRELLANFMGCLPKRAYLNAKLLGLRGVNSPDPSYVNDSAKYSIVVRQPTRAVGIGQECRDSNGLKESKWVLTVGVRCASLRSGRCATPPKGVISRGTP